VKSVQVISGFHDQFMSRFSGYDILVQVSTGYVRL
jgi:hypothetical protein